ncbi:MAG: DUF1467 family protein [Rhodobacter sp.]|nr:DUF1467 family protein [Rhodobacter sp.]
MSITAALVLFAVIWFMVLFITLPMGLTTQGDVGKVTPGTQAGAPAALNMKRRMRIVSMIAVVLWAIIASIIVWGGISVRDLDFFNRMGDAPVGETDV